MRELICPNCSFSAKISENKIPAGAKWVKCPQCRHRFEINRPTPENQQIPPNNGPKTTNGRESSPWENRLELGLLQGIYQTFQKVLFSPKAFFKGLAFNKGIKEPFAFGLLFGSIGTLLGFFWQFLFLSDKAPFYLQSLLENVSLNIIFLGVMIASPFIASITLFIITSIIHFFLFIVKGGQNGFEATFRVIALSQSTHVFSIIPFVGGFIGSIWNLIIMIIGIREIHENSYWRVFLAILMPVGLILVFIAIAMITAFASLF